MCGWVIAATGIYCSIAEVVNSCGLLIVMSAIYKTSQTALVVKFGLITVYVGVMHTLSLLRVTFKCIMICLCVCVRV